MNLKSKGAIELALFLSAGAIWLGSIATIIELTQTIKGPPTYSPWGFAWTIPTTLLGIAMTVCCLSKLKNFQKTEPVREKKHYQLASNRSFIVAACGYLERDRLRHDNMALVLGEVTCSYCIMDMSESAISVNKLIPDPTPRHIPKNPIPASNNPLAPDLTSRPGAL